MKIRVIPHKAVDGWVDINGDMLVLGDYDGHRLTIQQEKDGSFLVRVTNSLGSSMSIEPKASNSVVLKCVGVKD